VLGGDDEAIVIIALEMKGDPLRAREMVAQAQGVFSRKFSRTWL
jgi:hypothetical protein